MKSSYSSVVNFQLFSFVLNTFILTSNDFLFVDNCFLFLCPFFFSSSGGDGVTHAVPIFEGFALPHATNRMDLAGGDLTTMIRSRLAERGISFTRSEAHSTIVRNIKETLCCVSMNYETESKTTESMQYELPDGQVITVDPETRYGIAETLFTPTLFPNAKANGTLVWNV